MVKLVKSIARLCMRHRWVVLVAMSFLLLNVVYLFMSAPNASFSGTVQHVAQHRSQVHANASVGMIQRLRSAPTLSTRSSCHGVPNSIPQSPVADPRGTITIGGRMRITVLTIRTIRLEYLSNTSSHGSFDDRMTTAIVNRATRIPFFDYRLAPCAILNGECLIVDTKQLRLEVLAPRGTSEEVFRQRNGGLTVNWRPSRPSRDTFQIRVRVGSQFEHWWPGKQNDGQLPGTIRTLDNTRGHTELNCSALPAGMQEGSEQAAHCEMGLISRDGWALHDDSSRARLDGENTSWAWVAPRDPRAYADELLHRMHDGDARCAQWAGSGECKRNPAFMQTTCKEACDRTAAAARRRDDTSIDWYLFGAGLNFEGALADLSLLSGRQPIPPRFAFGVWFSRWWPWADYEAENLLTDFESHSIPLDVLITDMDWHHTCYRRTYGTDEEKSMDPSGNWPCWSGFTWDPKYFADPTQFLAFSKALGVHNGLNLHFQSGVQQEESAWPEFRDAMKLPKAAQFARFDPLNQSYSSAFHRHVLAPLERQGVDFWWLDWQQGEGYFAGTATPETNPTYWLNYVYATQPDGREMSDAHGPQDGGKAARHASRRRLIMHRYGGLGNQRYPIGFSGDVAALWESLAFQPFYTSSAANVNFGYWSHDIGGFYEPVEGELLVRWVQCGIFSPIVRIHGFRRAEIEKRPWHYPPMYFVPIRSALRLRIELVPHLYTAAWRAHLGGPSPVRPLYHDWPTQPTSYEHPQQFVFGIGLLVAPVTTRTQPGCPLAPSHFWLPPGTWVQLHSGGVLRGPTVARQLFALDEMPVLAQAGAVIFGQATPQNEWAHCAHAIAASASWLGRAQHLPRCPQASIWFGDQEWAKQMTSASGGSAILYEDDGWSDRYLSEGGQDALKTNISWRFEVASHPEEGWNKASLRLHVWIQPSEGCLIDRMDSSSATEPRQPQWRRTNNAPIVSGEPHPSGAAATSYRHELPFVRRSWRLVLHGLAPPKRVFVRRRDDTGVEQRAEAIFTGLAEMERRRRADVHHEAIWGVDASMLSVVVWIFNVHVYSGVQLEMEMAGSPSSVFPTLLPLLGIDKPVNYGQQRASALIVMRRAQASKVLCDATYPDTSPDDYDSTTWLAGMGARLAAHPYNWTIENNALGLTLQHAWQQLEDVALRVRANPDRLEYVQNATQLMREIYPRNAQ